MVSDDPVSPAIGVPPELTRYQWKVGLGKPDVEVTETVGTPIPHCVDGALAVGSVGTGTEVKAAVAVCVQPPVEVAVTV